MSSAIQASPKRTTELVNTLSSSSVQKWLAQIVPQTLSKYLTPERVCKIVVQAAQRNPILFECTKTSIIKSVADLVSLGIEPGSLLQQGYLVPKRNKGVWECQGWLGYRGMIALLHRSGQFSTVCANAVHMNDKFEIDLIKNEASHVPPANGKPRGEIVSVYCRAVFMNGSTHLDYLTMEDVDDHRKRSPAKDNGPWVSDFVSMARKTAVRSASKFWPMTTEDMLRMQAIDAKVDDETGSADVLDIPDFMKGELEEVSRETIGDSAGAPNATKKLTEKLQQKLPTTQDEAFERAAKMAAENEAVGMKMGGVE